LKNEPGLLKPHRFNYWRNRADRPAHFLEQAQFQQSAKAQKSKFSKQLLQAEKRTGKGKWAIGRC